MGNIITDRLELVIDAVTGGAVTEIKKATAASAEQATAQEQAALASANMTKAVDSQAVATAKLTLAQAREAGDAGAIATAQDAVSVATKKAAVSKAEAAVASNDLSLANLKAAASTTELGAASGASGGLMAGLGAKGGTALATITKGLATVGPLIAAVLGGKLLIDGVKQFVDLGDTIHSFQLVTGASATQASELVGQLKALGVDPDIAAKGMARLGAAIGDGSTKLGQFGIQVAHNADGTTNLAQTFENLRAAYSQSTDAATRDAIAKQVGLRGAAQLAPLLALDTQQIKALNEATKSRGEIFGQSDITNAHDLAVAGNQLKLSLQGLEVTIAKDLAPSLVTLANDLKGVIDWGTKAEHVFSAIVTLGHLHERIYGQTKDTANAHQLAAAQALAEADAEGKLTTALIGEYDAQRAVRDAAQSLADARFGEIDAQKALNDLLAKGAVDQTAVASAQKALASASEEVTKAQEAEANAQDALNKARERASALDLAEAQSKIALAGDKIGEANAKVQQAKESYDALLGSGSASAGELAAAAAAVKTAQDDATQAVLDQQQATVDLQTVKKKGTEQDPAVVSAEQAVRDAHRGVTDAVANRSDAEAKLRDAEKPDPNFQEEVAKAVNDVAKAHNAVKDAQEGQVTSALKLAPAEQALAAAYANQGQAIAGVAATLGDLNGQGINSNSLLELLALGPELSTLQAEGISGEALLSVLGATSSTPEATIKGHRAAGGPVEAYEDYLVGERGPEVLRMGSRSGTVIPHGSGGVGTGTRPVVIHHQPIIQVVGGPYVSQLAQQVARESAQSFKNTVVPRIHGRS